MSETTHFGIGCGWPACPPGVNVRLVGNVLRQHILNARHPLQRISPSCYRREFKNGCISVLTGVSGVGTLSRGLIG
jgi:hypothetical protein